MSITVLKKFHQSSSQHTVLLLQMQDLPNKVTSKLEYLEIADQRIPEFSECLRDNSAQLSLNTVTRLLCYLKILKIKSLSQYLFHSIDKAADLRDKSLFYFPKPSTLWYICPTTVSYYITLNKKTNKHLRLLTACKSKQLCCESFQDWLIIE